MKKSNRRKNWKYLRKIFRQSIELQSKLRQCSSRDRSCRCCSLTSLFFHRKSRVFCFLLYNTNNDAIVDCQLEFVRYSKFPKLREEKIVKQRISVCSNEICFNLQLKSIEQQSLRVPGLFRPNNTMIFSPST